MLSGSFYDRRGAIADSPPSPRGGAGATPLAEEGSGDDGGYTLTAYGELSPEEQRFTLPPSPTQTVKHRYRAFRPAAAGKAKLARALGPKQARAQAGAKTSSSAYHRDHSSVRTSSCSPSLPHALPRALAMQFLTRE